MKNLLKHEANMETSNEIFQKKIRYMFFQGTTMATKISANIFEEIIMQARIILNLGLPTETQAKKNKI